MKPNALKQLRASRVRALADGSAAPVAFGFWDDPELLTVEGDNRFEIHFNDMIDDWFGISAAMVVEALVTAGGRDVLVHLNSPGGMYTEGLAIHSAFKQYDGEVTFRIAGLAASAASFVMLAGDRIEITDGSLLMIHDAWDLTMGPADEHRRTADLLDKVSDSIAAMYARKAGGEPVDWRGLMREETWYAGQEAVDAGLVDAVADEETTEPAEDSTAAASVRREWSGIFARGRRGAAVGTLRPDDADPVRSAATCQHGRRTGCRIPPCDAPPLVNIAALDDLAQQTGGSMAIAAALHQPTQVGKPAVNKQNDQEIGQPAATFDWAALRDGLKGIRP